MFLLFLCVMGTCILAISRNSRETIASRNHCPLCRKNSLWEYYQKLDSVGILNLSNGQVLDTAILDYDDQGNLLGNSRYTSVYGYNDRKGRRCRFTTVGSQGVCRIHLAWEEASSVTLEELARLYCGHCMEEIRMLDEEWASGQADHKSCPFAMVDFSTRELYSLNRPAFVCSIRDYHVDLQCKELEVEGIVVYKPETVPEV